MASQIVLSNRHMCSVTLKFLTNRDSVSLAQTNRAVCKVVKEYFGIYCQILQMDAESRSLFAIGDLVQSYAYGATFYKPIPMASLLALMKGEKAFSRMELAFLFFLHENHMMTDFKTRPCSEAALTIVHVAGKIFHLLERGDAVHLCRKALKESVTMHLFSILSAVSCLSPEDRDNARVQYCVRKGITWTAQDPGKARINSLLNCFNDDDVSKEHFFKRR